MACLSDETVVAFARGALADEAVRDVEAHLSGCSECCALIAESARLGRPDSGESSLESPLLAPGTRVSRYVIEEVLGAGGAGVVYRARDSELQRKVALKTLHDDAQSARMRRLIEAQTTAAETLPSSSGNARSRGRWLREAQTMARLSHPHVINVYDLGTYQGQVFIVMELVEGQNLAQWSRAEPRSWRAILDVYVQAGRGLAAAHAAGLVHRDFKPENVLIGADGRPRVADFGLARALGETPREAIAGTPGYMAPEVLGGKDADARSDQFSFCVALYRSLYGQKPGEDLDVVPANSEVPPHVHSVLRRGLTADPVARFATMDDLLAALSPEVPAPGRGVPRRWVVGTAVAASVMALVVVRSRMHGSAAGTDGACPASVAMGYNHTCTLRRDGTVWCWGKVGLDRGGLDAAGEPVQTPPLQIQDADGVPLTKIAELASQNTTTCARELQGIVWCWGRDDRGKLGNERTVGGLRRAVAEKVKGPHSVDFLMGVTRIAPGFTHTCALRQEGVVWCWGANGSGQLGAAATSEPVLLPTALRAPGAAFVRVASGHSHTCGTRADGTLWCWGGNREGQLGTGEEPPNHSAGPLPVHWQDGTSVTNVADLSLNGAHTCVVTRDGGLFCWGGNAFGEIGSGTNTDARRPGAVQAADGTAMSGVSHVRAGSTFTCARKRDGTVWCFGDNSFGQLGAAAAFEASSRAVAVVTESGAALDGVEEIAAGSSSACALRRDGSVWCWGRNQGGQLGLGDARDRNVAVQSLPPCP